MSGESSTSYVVICTSICAAGNVAQCYSELIQRLAASPGSDARTLLPVCSWCGQPTGNFCDGFRSYRNIQGLAFSVLCTTHVGDRFVRSARRGLSLVLRAVSGLAFLADHELLRWKLLISSMDWPCADGVRGVDCQLFCVQLLGSHFSQIMSCFGGSC